MSNGALNPFSTIILLVATRFVKLESTVPLCCPSVAEYFKPRISQLTTINTTNWRLRRQSPRIDITTEGHIIGDEHRDVVSSTAFFSSIDQDGDGILAGSELSTFLRDDIGGDQYDTNEEIDVEVKGLLTRVDLDAESGLDQRDMMSYWDRNLGLFSVDDVIEWLAHAVQLPDDVQSTFCAHHVTGFDFPELIENSGERLKTELGITNSMHARKIIRHIKARMVGLESILPKVEPDIPELIRNRMSLTWKKIELESGFPVHKYRIQRKEFPIQELGGVLLRMLRISRTPPPDKWKIWETVYDDKDNVYIDVSRKAGFEYAYRIEAWNALGRSPWVILRKEGKDGGTYDNIRAGYFWFCLFWFALVGGIATITVCSDQRNKLKQYIIPPNGKSVKEILKGVVLVGILDTKAECIVEYGSGFIADNSRGLILTAGHIFYDIMGEKIEQKYRGRKNVKVIIGTLCKMKDADDRYTAHFTYFAEIIAHDIVNVDAAVLHITTKFQKPFKSLSLLQPDEPIMRGSFRDQNMTKIKLRTKAHPKERITIIGFNQSGEGRRAAGEYLNHTVSMANGDVCGTGHAGQHLVDTGESSLFRATKSEIIVEVCSPCVGHSSGPCVNQDGLVIGIMSRRHQKNDKRCYLAPASKLKKLLKKAQKVVDKRFRVK